MKVEFDRLNCIGCRACTTVCPEYWDMGDDEKSALKGMSEKNGHPGWYSLDIKSDNEAIECNKRAADICPVSVIHIN